MTSAAFLLLNLVLAFYNVGTIWAHKVDIFRTWKLIDTKEIFQECKQRTGESFRIGFSRRLASH